MRTISMILATVLLIFQTGCWNAREINELAFVLSLALDKTDNGFKVTAQIAKPDVYSKSSTGGPSTAEKEKPFWVISGNGKTIFEAVRSMASISPRRIFWSHIKVIIISEALARDNVIEIFDFFSRNPELRLRTWIAVTPGEAGKLLEVVPLMEREPSQHIERIIDKTNLIGTANSIMIKDFLEEYLDPYVDPVASRIIISKVNDRPTLKLEGASVFSGSNMVGWLNDVETRGFLWLRNKISGSVRVVYCPYDGLPLTLEIKKGKTTIKSFVSNGVPKFVINATAVGKLTEKACITNFNNPETINALESALSSAIHDDIESAVTAAQRLDSDFAGFGRTLERGHKNEWQQMSSNWHQLFKNADIEIQVKAEIPEVSLLAKPLVPIEGKSPNLR